MNERAFLALLESANADELAQILRRPTADEERLLEVYFGTERLQRLRGLALATQRRGLRAPAKGNVVVLHGIMGGELTVYPNPQSSQFIWMNIPRLAIGAAGWLRMTANLHSQFDVRATGILKKYYAEQILGLTYAGWNVKTFWFDWRQDLAGIADHLHQRITGWFGPSADVHLVAHSMGGLVSRTYILRHPSRWGKRSRLVMLGTPNHGSFAIPQVITGAYDTVRKLALLDLSHNLRDLCNILNGFPSSMQMLPSPLKMPEMDRMYRAGQWANWGVPQNILDVARASHDRLAKIVDGDRMTYIAGCNQVTKVGVSNWNRLDTSDSFTDSMAGDGTVPHLLGFLYEGSTRIPTYFAECSHGALPTRSDVLAATDQILQGAKPNLPTSIPTRRGIAGAKKNAVAKRVRETVEEETLRELSRRIRTRSRAVGDVHETPVSADEIRAGEILVRSLLQDESATTESPADTGSPITPSVAPKVSSASKQPPISIALSISHGGIQGTSGALAKADAISVGHYIGVAPQNAELAIDEAITAALEKNKMGETPSENEIITSLCRRGVIVGELGQNFLLPDPRDAKRVIVIAGMGQPGMFREAELAVLTRELIWSLGRTGRKNLCTVLIGAGAGNLEAPDAVRASLRVAARHSPRALRRAIKSRASPPQRDLRRIQRSQSHPDARRPAKRRRDFCPRF